MIGLLCFQDSVHDDNWKYARDVKRRDAKHGIPERVLHILTTLWLGSGIASLSPLPWDQNEDLTTQATDELYCAEMAERSRLVLQYREAGSAYERIGIITDNRENWESQDPK